MCISYEDLQVEVVGDKTREMNTIGWAHIKVTVATQDIPENVHKCLEKTVENCPVGVLFEKAGVEIKTELNLHSVQPA